MKQRYLPLHWRLRRRHTQVVSPEQRINTLCPSQGQEVATAVGHLGGNGADPSGHPVTEAASDHTAIVTMLMADNREQNMERRQAECPFKTCPILLFLI